MDAQKPGAENKDETKMEGEGAPTDATNGDTKSEDKKDQVSPRNFPTFIQCCGSGMFIFRIPDPDIIHPGSRNTKKREGGHSLVAIFSSPVECAFIRFPTNPSRGVLPTYLLTYLGILVG